MGRIHVLAAFCVLALSENAALAQGLIQWETGRPRTGSAPGSIEIKGTVTLEAGWHLLSANVVAEAWQDGGAVKTVNVPIERRQKTWGVFRLMGLEPGATYNVIVTVSVTDGANVETLGTAFKKVQAAK
jgi:hypothetical protein